MSQLSIKQFLRLFPCVFLQGDSEICPTPDAPRGQTKAPRLDIYRPAPHVVVDTGGPQRNKLPQDQTDPDRFRLQDHGQVVAQTQTHSTQSKDQINPDRFRPQDYGQVVAQTQTNKSQPKDQWQPQTRPGLRPEDHGQVVPQTQIHSSQPKDQTNPNRFRPQDHGQVVFHTQTNMSQPKGQGRLQTRADLIQTKPPGTQAKTIRLEDLELTPPRAQTKPPAFQERDELQAESTPPRDKPVKNGSSYGEDKKKTDAERHHRHHRHHHHHHHEKDQGHENKENKAFSANGASSAVAATSVADEDYAVKYRLGLVPRRSNEPKRKSEYQRQFQWRSFERNSPLMSAAQVLTDRHTHTFIQVIIYLFNYLVI